MNIVKKTALIAFLIALFGGSIDSFAQQPVSDSSKFDIVLLSDTQAPMAIEELAYKTHQNTVATRKIFDDINLLQPQWLFILGDVVSLGYRNSSWKEIDKYLSNARKKQITVTALLGNHDVMFSPKNGEANFLKRFPDQVNTGFLKIVDSIAFILLNSNFKTLTTAQLQQQQDFYVNSLRHLDLNSAVKFVIVTCHHPPFSNSKVVGSNQTVQDRFLAPYYASKKAKLFITGHAHAFEHFTINGKDFLTIGGGGGLHQTLNAGMDRILSKSFGYDPEFHYLLLRRNANQLSILSRYLKPDFSAFENSYRFVID